MSENNVVPMRPEMSELEALQMARAACQVGVSMGYYALPKRITAAIVTLTQMIQARVKQQMTAEDVLRAYEKWEADIINTGTSWNTEDGLPKLNQAQYDRWIELQEMRDKALKGGE